MAGKRSEAGGRVGPSRFVNKDLPVLARSKALIHAFNGW